MAQRASHFLTLFFALIALLLPACVTRRAVLLDYAESLRGDSRPPVRGTTLVCILVDGLGTALLEKAVTANAVPVLRDYFLRGEGRVHRGLAAFPSVTYPNVTSLLTARAIDQHPISGNKVRWNGKLINFESPLARGELNRAIEPLSVFTIAAARGSRSVSFAHYFRAGATVPYPSDLEAGLSYASGDYLLVDEKLIDSASELLSQLDPSDWPSIVFLHLSGVDSVAHREGPSSPEPLRYLAVLDKKLERILAILSRAESSGKSIVSILTADHGFTELRSYFDVDRFVTSVDPAIDVANEMRFASLYFPPGKRDADERRILQRVPAMGGIALYASRVGDEVRVQAGPTSATLTYHPMECPASSYGLSLRFGATLAGETFRPECPEEFDREDRQWLWPYFVSGLAAYFRSPNHADAILVAADSFSFQLDQRGGHGGFKEEERVVPILLRNAVITGEPRALPTHLLLMPLRH